MGKIERQLKALESYLAQMPRITLMEAGELLDVSESTVRRLFVRMEEQGQALRVHGGLQALPNQKADYNFSSVETRCLAQKKRIARAAVDEIGTAHTIFLDSGSTVYQFSLCLAEWIRTGRRDQVSVFTNSLKNLQVLAGIAKIQFIGGQYREHRQDCCGFLAEEAIQSLNFDLCVLGADGCDVEQGISCTDMETASLGSLVVNRSLRRIVLMDSTKFRKRALVSYAGLEDINMVITDTGLDADIVGQARERGTEVRLV